MTIKLTAAAIMLAFFCHAQESITYQKPSAEILKLADYERPPSVLMNSKKDKILLLYRPTYKSLDDLNQEEMRLGGLRINPVTNISSSMNYIQDLKIKGLKSDKEQAINGLPDNAKIAYLSFSPDDEKIAFTNTTTKGVELWVADLKNATAKKLTSDNLNANLGNPFVWLKDSKTLLIKKIPANRADLLDDKKTLPTGPTVSVSDGKVSQNRTYPDLLKTPLDEKNFETLTLSELQKVDLNGTITPFKSAAIYTEIKPSPDGKFVLITDIKKPFSYIVPLYRFPSTTQVFDISGNLVKKVNEVPLTEIMPKGFSSTRTGKRAMQWRSDAPSTLVFVEALDAGDASKTADFRDEIFIWQAPFDQAPKSLFKTKQRYGGIHWSKDGDALISEEWYDTRNLKTHWLNPKTGFSKVIEDRNSQDVYQDPGNFNQTKNEFGEYVIDAQNKKAYLLGEGFSEKGQHPFVDELNLETFAKKRIYHSDLKNTAENIIDFDAKKGEILVVQQSPKDFPNYFTKNFKTGKATAVTNIKNPFEGLNNVYKEVLKYQRNDGVELNGTLYLPANFDRKNPQEKLPLLIWAYPTEYKDKNTAGQNTQNPNDFTYPSYGSFIYWASKGYAVLDDASFPIIGEGKEEPNDTFRTQLVANGRAAIDALDKLGYIDRKKVAVGGHSYGAFMTANLLTHSQDYACGIARSGAYNRTLTPFGFQREQRNFWDVPNVYNDMSPFMHADKMNTPMLLIHGEADNNPGTFTLQTERYFQALKNLGKPVRMVLLPKEQHGYQAKENILHVLWEEDQFLEKCLKNK